MDWKERIRVFGRWTALSENLPIADETDGVVSLHMGAKFAAANMQGDAAAFETWALAVKVAGARKVVLRWNKEDQKGAHFGRFCYRVTRFQEIFSAWFDVDPLCGTQIPSEPNGGQPRFLLNEEGEVRLPGNEQTGSLDLTAREHDLELALAGAHKAAHFELMNRFELEILRRQLPVGVYDGELADQNVVCPGDHSAADLWGITGRGKLVLFELKNEGNKKLGALAELFFYSILMRDLQRGVVGFKQPTPQEKLRPYHKIPATKGIDAYILAPSFHPLIEGMGGAVLKLLNQALAADPFPIRFGLARLLEQPPFVEIAKPA